MRSNAKAIVVGCALALVSAGVAIADGHPLPAPLLHAITDLAHVVGIVPVANGGTNSGTALSGSGAIVTENGSAIIQGPAGTTTTLLHGNAAGQPTYSAVSETADITGTCPIANGGTNSATALSGSSIMDSDGTHIVQGPAGTATTLLHGNAAGQPTYSAVDLAADVTGVLPDANVSDTLTASIFKGSGSTTDAIDLATAEVAGTLPIANVNTTTLATLAGANVFSNAANEFDGSVLLGEISAPSVSAANKAKCYVDSTSHTVKCSLNTGAYSDILTALTGLKLSGGTVTGTLTLSQTVSAALSTTDFQLIDNGTSTATLSITGGSGAALRLRTNAADFGWQDDRSAVQASGCFADNIVANGGGATDQVCAYGSGKLAIVNTQAASCAAGVLALDPTSSVVYLNANSAACVVTLGEANAVVGSDVLIVLTSNVSGAVTFPTVSNVHASGLTICTTTGLSTIGSSYLIHYAATIAEYVGVACSPN